MARLTQQTGGWPLRAMFAAVYSVCVCICMAVLYVVVWIHLYISAIPDMAGLFGVLSP